MHRAEVARPRPAQPPLQHPRVVGGGEAVGDEAAVEEVVVEGLQADPIAVPQRAQEVDLQRARVGVVEVAIGDEHRAAAELRRAHAGVEGEARVGRGREAEVAGDQPARPDLHRLQAAVAVQVLQRGVAAGDVGPVVDQRLGQPVPAGRLHRALVAARLGLGLQPPARREVQAHRALQHEVLRVDPAVVARPGLRLDIEEGAAGQGAQVDGGGDLAVEHSVAVAPAARLGVAAHRLRPAALRVEGGAGHDVEQAPDLAGSEHGRRRPANDVHALGRAQHGGVGAAVLDALEAVEVGLGQGAAHVQGARHAVVAVGEGARHHGDQVVHRARAVAIQRLRADEGGGAGRLQERQGQAEDGAGRAALQEARGVGGDHHLGDGGRGGGGRGGGDRRARGDGRSLDQRCRGEKHRGPLEASRTNLKIMIVS